MSWVDIQQNAFTRWCNEHLKERGLRINDLSKDLQDGLMLINLCEIISGKKLPRHNKHPIVPYQKYENNGIAIKFLQDEGIKLVNISNEDITNGRLKLILGLIWTLILRYHIKRGDDGSAKSELLKWVNSKIGPDGYNIKNFQKDWNDGKAICALVNAVERGTIPDHAGLNPANGVENCRRGMDTAYNVMGIPQVLLPEEMANPKVHEQAVMTYIGYLRDYDEQRNKNISDASRCRAYGPGLQEAIVNEDAQFFVETPGRGKLEVKVEGPKSTAVVQIKPLGEGRYDVKYNPKEPGEYRIHVTLDGIHIPGSIFHVTVLDQISLGGEGKIRVFYSTTSAKDEKMRPLQELLQAKEIHKRPDFEPWIPVDIMEPKDRDQVFKKAGTKNLPIVYIDDVYVGDAKTIFEKNASGELDRLLNYRGKYTGASATPTIVDVSKDIAKPNAASQGAYRSLPS